MCNEALAPPRPGAAAQWQCPRLAGADFGNITGEEDKDDEDEDESDLEDEGSKARAAAA